MTDTLLSVRDCRCRTAAVGSSPTSRSICTAAGASPSSASPARASRPSRRPCCAPPARLRSRGRPCPPRGRRRAGPAPRPLPSACGGRRLGFVPQDPASALNPVRTIGSQAQEAAALTGERDAARRRAAIVEVFDRVGLADPERVYRSYPHQLSGGMLQRVLIGLAVLPEPALLVADEPTSALDVTIQKRILDLLTDLRTSLGIGLLLITHDLALAAERADDLVVLRDGVVQEAGPVAEVFASPRSAYAAALRADVPALSPDRYRAVLAQRRIDPARPAVQVSDVVKTFRVGGDELRAVDDVSFEVAAGSTHALVGESGSGKTTTVRLLLGLETRMPVTSVSRRDRARAFPHGPAHRAPSPAAGVPEPLHVARPVVARGEPGPRAPRPLSRGRPARATRSSPCGADRRGPARAPVGSPRRRALGRSAPARRDRPCPGARARRARARRADQRAGRHGPGRDPRRAGATAGRAGADLPVRLPRPRARPPDRGHRHGSPSRPRRRARAAAEVLENPRHPYTRSLVAAVPDPRGIRSSVPATV